MTKEELRKEAEEYLTKLLKRLKISKEDLAENQPEFLDLKKMNIISLNVSNVSKAYLASAEPREKRIAELEKENGELKAKANALENANKAMIKELDDITSGGISVLENVVRSKEQLTKAKEIIQTLIESLEVSEGEEIGESKVVKEAEQFLKEK